ncbi:hypothetical protein KAT24_02025 [Candidatus Pacearchaeota archaeon]|nr:hypothetical protein [Candidatus Pacearchaeota archaeon]
MKSLKILSLILSFAVIAFIGFRALNTRCFSSIDVNLSLGALIFNVIVELVSIRRQRI